MRSRIYTELVSANQSFAASGIKTELEVAYFLHTSYDEMSTDWYTTLKNLVAGTGKEMQKIHAIRDLVNADFVQVLFSKDSSKTADGLGNATFRNGGLVDQSRAYSLVKMSTIAKNRATMLHEMGHNLGANHDWIWAKGSDSFKKNSDYPNNYNLGFVAGDKSFRTIMSYKPSECRKNQCARIYRWSNPRVTYKGKKTGRARNGAQAADNALQIFQTYKRGANFRVGPGMLDNIPEVKSVFAPIGTTDRLTVIWKADPSVTGFRVIGTKSGNVLCSRTSAACTASVCSCTITSGLKANSTYSLSVVKYKTDGTYEVRSSPYLVKGTTRANTGSPSVRLNQNNPVSNDNQKGILSLTLDADNINSTINWALENEVDLDNILTLPETQSGTINADDPEIELGNFFIAENDAGEPMKTASVDVIFSSSDSLNLPTDITITFTVDEGAELDLPVLWLNQDNPVTVTNTGDVISLSLMAENIESAIHWKLDTEDDPDEILELPEILSGTITSDDTDVELGDFVVAENSLGEPDKLASVVITFYGDDIESEDYTLYFYLEEGSSVEGPTVTLNQISPIFAASTGITNALLTLKAENLDSPVAWTLQNVDDPDHILTLPAVQNGTIDQNGTSIPLGSFSVAPNTAGESEKEAAVDVVFSGPGSLPQTITISFYLAAVPDDDSPKATLNAANAVRIKNTGANRSLILNMANIYEEIIWYLDDIVDPDHILTLPETQTGVIEADETSVPLGVFSVAANGVNEPAKTASVDVYFSADNNALLPDSFTLFFILEAGSANEPVINLFPAGQFFDERHKMPGTGFSSRNLTPLSIQPDSLRYKELGLYLSIPTLEQDVQIVEAAQTDDSWAIEWLDDRAGLLEGSAKPGEGISYIAAHNHLNNLKFGPFLALGSLKQNDRIFVRMDNGKNLTFRVFANELLVPDDGAAVDTIARSGNNTLVLITCENESAEGGYLNRRVVFAELL